MEYSNLLLLCLTNLRSVYLELEQVGTKQCPEFKKSPQKYLFACKSFGMLLNTKQSN
jgi:hypothetical protein